MSEIVLERTRLIGTIKRYQKLPKDKQKVVKYVPDDESDSSTMKNIVIIGDLKNYKDMQPIKGVSEENILEAFMYMEGKVGMRAEDRFFIGNDVALDAEIVFDEDLKMYKLNRVTNICGKSVVHYGYLSNDRRTLLPGAVFQDFCSREHCTYCKHYDYSKKKVRKSCAENIYGE